MCKRRFGERDVAAAAEPDVAAPAVDGQALDLLLGTAGRDPEIQRLAVAVQARFGERADLFDGQFSLPHVIFHPIYPTDGFQT